MPYARSRSRLSTGSTGSGAATGLGSAAARSARPQTLEPRVVSGAGNYVYQQFPSGRIVILDGPAAVGKVLTEGTAWDAITREIGAYPTPPTTTTTNETPTTQELEAEEAESAEEDTSLLDWFAEQADEVGEAWGSLVDGVESNLSSGVDQVLSWWSSGDEEEDATVPETVAPAEEVDQNQDTEDVAQQVDEASQDEGSPAEAPAEVKAMSQFVWYGRGHRDLDFEESAEAQRIVSDTFGIGSYGGAVTAPPPHVRGKNPNQGYWWDRDDGKPTWNGATWARGSQYVQNKVSWSLKLNDVTSYLSLFEPGDRPGYMKDDGQHFKFSRQAKSGFEKVPEKARNVDLLNIPGGASCYATSEAMLNQDGQTAAWGHQIVGIVEDETITESTRSFEMNASKSEMALAYLDFETSQGNPIMVGTTYSNRNGGTRQDNVTDHWVVVDSKVGEGRFSFHDPGTISTEQAAGDNLVFEWDGQKLQSTDKKKYVVSYVRVNQGTLKAWQQHWAAKQAQG